MRSHLRLRVRGLARLGWQCWICRTQVPDYLKRCPLNH